jgi:RNA polymerase sigma-70 factor (ECF subfamily)
VKRYLPILRRWAHGRLPGRARDMSDTDDLVQVALMRGLGQVENFDQRRTGAFLAYVRQIVRNQIRDEIRRPARRAQRVELTEDLPDGGVSPLEEAIGKQSLERYESALMLLPRKQRESVVMRLEMGFAYREIADALDFPTEEAARVAIRRALERMKRTMPGPEPS